MSITSFNYPAILQLVPKNWNKGKIGHLATIAIGWTPPTGNSEYFEGENTWVTIADMITNSVSDSKQKITDEAIFKTGIKKVPKGSLLYSFKLSVGKVAFAAKDLYTNEAIAAITPKSKIDNSFLFYVTKAYLLFYANENIYGAKLLNQQLIKNALIVYPDLPKQKKIAQFLDHKVAKIDEAIAKKKKLLELLEEKRINTITAAITKGLDKSVLTKKTDIEWIGSIPQHWQVRRLSTLSTIKRGASPRPIDDTKYFYEDGEYSWVRIADVTRQYKYLENAPQRLSTLGKSLSVALEPGELFLSIAASVGKPMITKIKCCIHDGFIYFKNPKVDREFLYYIFAAGEAYKGLGKLGTQLNLNSDTVGDIPVALPPDEEQSEIVTWLNRKIDFFSATQIKVKRSIGLLEEYKTSLISNAVTGKVEV